MLRIMKPGGGERKLCSDDYFSIAGVLEKSLEFSCRVRELMFSFESSVRVVNTYFQKTNRKTAKNLERYVYGKKKPPELNSSRFVGHVRTILRICVWQNIAGPYAVPRTRKIRIKLELRGNRVPRKISLYIHSAGTYRTNTT